MGGSLIDGHEYKELMIKKHAIEWILIKIKFLVRNVFRDDYVLSHLTTLLLKKYQYVIILTKTVQILS